ncbi:MAG: nucleotide sugar dehydrogenase, partial [Planctomycetales bacterium]|nr:nucleotide sugar dehydrogenase [Planctomycetales bacterium]
SPSIEIIELLRERGAKVAYNDPFFKQTHKQREHDLRMKSTPLTPASVKGFDCVLIATDHSSYDYQWIVDHAQLVVDTRNATAGCKRVARKVVKA